MRKKIFAAVLIFAMVFPLMSVITASASDFTPVTGWDMMERLGIGYTFANTTEARPWPRENRAVNAQTAENSWGQPRIQGRHFDSVAAMGFDSYRLCVTWTTHMDANFNIDPAWMNRVQQLVDYALDAGLYVILNTHHEEELYWLIRDGELDAAEEHLNALWTQIAARFADYSERLIFEILNEPNLLDYYGGPGDWVHRGGRVYRPLVDRVNHLNASALEVIRNSGGNNAQRVVIFGVPGAHPDALPYMQVPADDPYIMLGFFGYGSYGHNFDALTRTVQRVLDRGIAVVNKEDNTAANWGGLPLTGSLERRTLGQFSRWAQMGVPSIWFASCRSTKYGYAGSAVSDAQEALDAAFFNRVTGEWDDNATLRAIFAAYEQQVAADFAPPPLSSGYRLSEDSNIQNLAHVDISEDTPSPFLTNAGNPTLATVQNPLGGNAIIVTDRRQNWYALDVLLEPMNLSLATQTYRFYMSGSTAEPATIILGAMDGPWTRLFYRNTDADGSFSVEGAICFDTLEATEGGAAQFLQRGFRIQTDCTTGFVVYEIIFEPLTAEIQPAPIPTVPPVNVPPVMLEPVTFYAAPADPETSVTIDGVTVVFADQGPEIIEARTLVPIRGVFEHLGFTVDWDDNARAAILTRADFNVILPLNSYVFTTNGVAHTIEVPAQIINERTMLPIRAVVESVGYNVVWDAETRTVVITTVAAEVPEPAEEEPEAPQHGYVYSLSHDPGVRDVAAGGDIASSYLSSSGGVTLTVTENGGINATTRQNNWDGIDIIISALNLSPASSYTIEVTGRAIAPIPADADMFLQLSTEGSWPWLGGTPVSAASPNFTLSYTFTPQDEYSGRPFTDFDAIRIQTNPEAAAMSFTVDSIVIAAAGAVELEIPSPPVHRPGEPVPSLAEAFADYFIVGNIWGGHMSNNRILDTPGAAEHFLHHYTALTAENHHKPDNFATRANFNNPAAWNWAESDFIVNWAYENDLYMVGHVLVWHSQSHPWFTTVHGSTTPLTRAEAIANMEHHINAVAGRYAGRMDAWEVVNEVFVWVGASDWNANPNWRHFLRRANAGLDPRTYSQWYNAFANGAEADECGSDFIYYAFRFARLADPNALLKYNDYGEYNPGKREAIAQMTEQINARWQNDPLYDGRLLIEVLGMQGHYNVETSLREVRRTIQRYAATGARVHITELDVRFNELTDWGAGFHLPARRPLTAAELRRQANVYRDLFALFMEYSDYIDRVSFWGLADEWSWLSASSPLHFSLDGYEFVPKPAFWAIMELVE